MNTKLAINLLTEAGNNLTVTLAALGLLDNGETIKSLQQKVDQSIKAAFDKQLQLSSKLDIAEGKLQVADEALRLAVSHNTTEQERLWELKKEQGELQIAIKNLEDKKKILADNGNGDKGKIKQEIETIKGKINTTDAQIKDLTQKITDGLALVARYDNLIIQGNTAQNNANYHNQFVQRWDVVGYESGRSGKKKAIYGWVTNQEQVNLRDGYQNQANQFRAEANSIQGSVDDFNKNKSILQETKDSKNNELWLLYHELDAKNNLLSFVGTRSDNELALVNLQLDQGKEDLQQLEKTEIPSQEKAAQATNLKVTQAQSDLDKLKTDKLSAQKDLDNFVKDNKELLTTDLSLGLLKDAITKVQDKITSLKGDLAKPNQSATTIKGLNEAIAVEQGKLGQLKQQYQLLGLEALEVNQGRLESFNQQQATETSVNNAVKVNTIEGYVVLLPQLVQQMTGLSDVWVQNLKQNHGFTLEVSNLLQNNLTAFDGLTKYIGDKFADPYSDYSLNKIQLDEAIAIQDTQVKYRDALAQAVDDLGENIALQKKAVEQADALSGKLNHVRNLMKYEKDYATLQTAQKKLALALEQLSNFDWNSYNLAKAYISESIQLIKDNLKDYPDYKKITQNLDGFLKQYNDLWKQHQDYLKLNGYGINFGLWQDHGGTLSQHQWQLGDFNGDGKTDLIVANIDNDYYVSLSNGNGFTTSLWQNHGGTLSQHQWQLGDFNGDGKTDLIVANIDNDYYVSLSNGNGFTTSLWQNHGGTLSQHQWRLGDFNGDGKTDLIVANIDNDYYVSLSNGNGFTTSLWQNHGGTLSQHQWQLGDFNGDGKTDLIVANVDNDYYVSLSNGNGFTTKLWFDGGGRLSDHQWQLGDFNGDGKTDLIVANVDNDYYVSLSNGNGFTTKLWFDGGGRLSDHQWQLGDFNGDGKTDLILANINNDYYLATSTGDGFISKLWFDGGGRLSDHQWQLGDFNGDKKTDLILANINNDYYVAKTTDLAPSTEAINPLKSLQFNIQSQIDQISQFTNPYLIDKLNQELTNKTQDLVVQIDLTNDQQEQWIETNLQKYIEQKKSNILGSSLNQDQSISNLQNLRLETAYLTLQAEKDSNKLQGYLQKYQSISNTKYQKLVSWEPTFRTLNCHISCPPPET